MGDQGYYGGQFCYYLGARSGKYSHGYTSKMAELSHLTKLKTPISAIHFDSKEESLQYLSQMQSLKSPFLVDTVHFDEAENTILIERLGKRLVDLFKDEAEKFANSKDYPKYWVEIGGKYVKSYRSAMLGVKFLSENKKCFVDVADITVTGTDCKFTEIINEVNLAGRTTCKAILELRESMLWSLLQVFGPKGTVTKENEQSKLESLLLPPGLLSFFKTSRDPLWVKWDDMWKLDEAALWGSEEKYIFYKKVAHLYDKNKGRESYYDMMKLAKMQSYEGIVLARKDRMTEMYQKSRKDVNEAENKRKSNQSTKSHNFYATFEFELQFFRLAKFVRAAPEHYDDYAKDGNVDAVGHLEVAEKVDDMFNGTCHLWRAGFWQYWGYTKHLGFSWRDDMEYLLSWNSL